jgi:proline iminopeptidase
VNPNPALLIASLIPSLLGAPASFAQTPPEMLLVRGKQLYVEVLGPVTAPAVLYLHGGPGTGAYDFTRHQGGRLSPVLRLVAMDQRGVLRSDPLGDTEAFGLEDLIEDCEAVRRALGIDRWAVIGHSFGGYLAVRYALKYPAAVTAVVLESPTLDLGSSARSLLRRAAAEYRALGRASEAEACVTAAAAPTTSDQVWSEFTRLSNGLGPARNNLYVYGPDKGFFDALVAESPIPREWWRRQNLFQQRLYAEKRVFESLLPACPR